MEGIVRMRPEWLRKVEQRQSRRGLQRGGSMVIVEKEVEQEAANGHISVSSCHQGCHIGE